MCLEKTFTLFETPVHELFGDKKITDSAYTILLMVDALGGPIFGQVAQKVGLHCSIVICLSLMVLSTLVFASGLTVSHVYAGYFIGGLAISSIYAPATVAAVQLMPRKAQGFASSMSMTGIVAFAAIFALPIKQSIEQYGAQVGFCVQGVLICTALGLCALLLPRLPENSSRSSLPDRTSLARHSCEDAGDDYEASVRSSNKSSFAVTSPTVDMPNQTGQPCNEINKVSFGVLYIGYLMSITTYYFLESQIQPILEDTLPQHTAVLEMALPIFLVEEGIVRIGWGYAICKRPATICLVTGLAVVTIGFNIWASFSASCFVALPTIGFSFCGATCVWPLMPVLVARIFPQSQAMTVYALLNTAGVTAGIICGPFTAASSTLLGWPVTLRMFSLLPVCAAVAVLLRTVQDEFNALSQQRNISRLVSPRSGAPSQTQ